MIKFVTCRGTASQKHVYQRTIFFRKPSFVLKKCKRDDSFRSSLMWNGRSLAVVGGESLLQILNLNREARVKPAHRDKDFLLLFLCRIHRLHNGYLLTLSLEPGGGNGHILVWESSYKMSMASARFRGIKRLWLLLSLWLLKTSLCLLNWRQVKRVPVLHHCEHLLCTETRILIFLQAKEQTFNNKYLLKCQDGAVEICRCVG